MLLRQINSNIYINILSEWLTQKEMVIFDTSTCNSNERKYLMKFIYPLVNIKIFKIFFKTEKESEIIRKISFFQNRNIKYYCIYFKFPNKISGNEILNIFKKLKKNKNITKLIVENGHFDLSNVLKKYSNINSLESDFDIFYNYFKNYDKILKLSFNFLLNPLFFEYQITNLISFSANIEKKDESKLIAFLKKCKFLQHLSIYFVYGYTYDEDPQESKLLRLLSNTSDDLFYCSNLKKIKIEDAFIECENSTDAEIFLINLSLKHPQLISLELYNFAIMNIKETSTIFIWVERQYGRMSFFRSFDFYKIELTLSYKTLGNIDMILKMLKNLKDLKHFGFSYCPHNYLQQIIKNTNIETLKINDCFIDYETMNYRRNNKYFG